MNLPNPGSYLYPLHPHPNHSFENVFPKNCPNQKSTVMTKYTGYVMAVIV